MKSYLFIGLQILTSLCLVLNAQAQQTDTAQFARLEKRLEINAENKENKEFMVFQLKERGVLFLETHTPAFSEDQTFTFTCYDTSLNKKWTEILPLSNDLKLVHYCLDGPYMYLMFNEERFDYQIYSININDGRWYPIPYRRLFKAVISQFKAVAGQLVMTGESDAQSFIMHLDPKTNEQKIVSGSQYDDYYLANLATDTTSQTFSVVLAGKTSKTKSIVFCNYEANGTLIEKATIPNQTDYNLLSFKAFAKSKDRQILLGAYALRQWSKPQGIYVADMRQGEKPVLKFYDFCYLNNFFGYMKPAKREKYLSRIREKKKDGENSRYNLDLVLDDITLTDNKLVLSGETFTTILQDNRNALGTGVFSPTLMVFNPMLYTRMPYYAFGANTFPYYGYNNIWNNPINSPQVTQYDYKQAFVCVFDLDGRLLWDNSISLEDIRTINPNLYLACSVMGEQNQLLYLEKGMLFYKNTQKSAASDSVFKQTLMPESPNDRVYDRQGEVFTNWYGNKYLYYGTQQIRNTEKQTRRKVFFISSLRIESPTK